MYLDSEKKKEIFGTYGKSNTDTGSPEAQIALLNKKPPHVMCDGFLLYMIAAVSDAVGCPEQSNHLVKALQGVTAKLGQRLAGTFHRLGALIEPALGKELVGIADDLLLKALGQEVARWSDRQVLGNDLGCSDASARVALTHASVAVQPQRIKHPASQNTMQDIGLSAMAADARGISTAHADVMQHGSLLDKLDVHGHALPNEPLGQRHGQVGNLTAMMNQHPVIIITGCVVSFNDG